MRLRFFSLGMVLALALVVTGCGGGEKKDPSSNNSSESGSTEGTSNGSTQGTSRALHPYEKTVQQFLVEAGESNTQGAFALLTPVAQKAHMDAKIELDLRDFVGMTCRITGSDPIADSNGKYFGVYVDMVGVREDVQYQFDTIWCVQKIGNDYRIASFMFNTEDSEEGLVYDFENPLGSQVQETQQSAVAGQQPMNPAMQQAPANVPAQVQPQFGQQYPQQTAQPMNQTPQFNSPNFQNAQPQTMQPQQTAQPTMPNFQ